MYKNVDYIDGIFYSEEHYSEAAHQLISVGENFSSH